MSTEANAKVFLGESTITHNSAASLESFWSPRVVCCFVHIFSLTICHPTSEAMLWGRSHWRVWWCEPNGPHRCGWQSPWHRIKGCIGLGLRIGNPTFKVCFASPNYATAVPFDPNVYLLDQKSESTSQRQRSQKIHRGVKTKWVNVLKWGTPPSHLFGAKASFREDWDLKTPSFWATQHSVRKRSRTVLSSWLSTIQHWLSKAARPGLGCRVYHDYMVPF